MCPLWAELSFGLQTWCPGVCYGSEGQPSCLRSVEEWSLPSWVGVLPLIFPLDASSATWRLSLVLQPNQTCQSSPSYLPPWFSLGVLPCACAVLCSIVANSLRPHGL